MTFPGPQSSPLHRSWGHQRTFIHEPTVDRARRVKARPACSTRRVSRTPKVRHRCQSVLLPARINSRLHVVAPPVASILGSPVSPDRTCSRLAAVQASSLANPERSQAAFRVERRAGLHCCKPRLRANPTPWRAQYARQTWRHVERSRINKSWDKARWDSMGHLAVLETS